MILLTCVANAYLRVRKLVDLGLLETETKHNMSKVIEIVRGALV